MRRRLQNQLMATAVKCGLIFAATLPFLLLIFRLQHSKHFQAISTEPDVGNRKTHHQRHQIDGIKINPSTYYMNPGRKQPISQALLLPKDIRGRLYRLQIPEENNSKPVISMGLGFTYKNPSSMGVTSPERSRFWIVRNTANGLVKKNTFLTLRIEAIDRAGRLKTIGGDFWFVSMRSAKHPRTGTAGKVVDHMNGTYTAYLYAGWSGQTIINVTLVHSSDAVQVLKKNYINVPNKREFLAQYNEGIDYETTVCVLQRGGTWTDKCEYFNHNSLINTRLLCEKPSNLTCDSLIRLTRQPPPELDPDTAQWLHSNFSYKRLLGGPTVFKIEDDQGEPLRSPLPCGPNLPEVKSTGFWYKSHWNSLVCDYVPRPIQAYEKCLVNTSVYFLGDFIIRKMALVSLGALQVTNQKPLEKYVWFSYTHPTYDTTITFRQHIYNIIPDVTSVRQEKYEADVIATLPKSKCDYIIVVGPWSLFGSWDPESYREYLEFLRQSIENLQKRCPNAKAIIRSPQPWKEMTTLDYYYFMMRGIMKDVFADANVFILDVYDMILGANWHHTLQVPDDMIVVQLNLILNYVCTSLLE